MTLAAAAAMGAGLRRRCTGDFGVDDAIAAAVDLLHETELVERAPPLLTFGLVVDARGRRLVSVRGPRVDPRELERFASERRATFLLPPLPEERLAEEYGARGGFGFSAEACGRAAVVAALSRDPLAAADVEPFRLAALALTVALLDSREARLELDEASRAAARTRALEQLCDLHATVTERSAAAARSALDRAMAEREQAAAERQAELVVRNQKLRRTQRAMLNVIEDLREARARLEERVAERTKRYQATFHQAAVGLAEVALDGRWIATNARLCEIVGYSADELHRGAFQDITHPEDLGADLEHVRDLLAGRSSAYSMEKRYIRKDGRPVWVLLTVALVRGADGSPEYFISVVQDIDDAKRLERERDDLLRRERRAREDAQRTAGFADQFIGMLGHDLRNPLNAVMMAAQLLHRTAARDVDRQLVSRILSSGRRMANMVSQLLDLTRSRLAGGIPIERKRVELAAVVRGAVDELRHVHPAREIRSSLAEALHGDWDAERLAQVVSNLVGNALEHADPAHPIEVRLERRPGRALLEVRSRGPAIPADVLPVLFDPYRRGTARAAKSQGLGLGLFISNQIVVAHGGHMAVASSPEQGTTFTVVLPLDAGELASVACP